MAWYHVFQFAEVVDPLYPNLRGKSLPIIRLEILDHNKTILRVQVSFGNNNYEWFDKNQVILFKGGKELIHIPDSHHSKGFFKKFLKTFNLKEF